MTEYLKMTDKKRQLLENRKIERQAKKHERLLNAKRNI